MTQQNTAKIIPPNIVGHIYFILNAYLNKSSLFLVLYRIIEKLLIVQYGNQNKRNLPPLIYKGQYDQIKFMYTMGYYITWWAKFIFYINWLELINSCYNRYSFISQCPRNASGMKSQKIELYSILYQNMEFLLQWNKWDFTQLYSFKEIWQWENN